MNCERCKCSGDWDFVRILVGLGKLSIIDGVLCPDCQTKLLAFIDDGQSGPGVIALQTKTGAPK